MIFVMFYLESVLQGGVYTGRVTLTCISKFTHASQLTDLVQTTNSNQFKQERSTRNVVRREGWKNFVSYQDTSLTTFLQKNALYILKAVEMD